MIERHHSNHRMSQIVSYNATVYLAGQVAKDPSQDIVGQTRQILAQIDTLLDQASTDRSRLLSANIWVSDIREFQAINDVWDGWIDQQHPPVRACVEARLARPELRVEIQVVAARQVADG